MSGNARRAGSARSDGTVLSKRRAGRGLGGSKTGSAAGGAASRRAMARAIEAWFARNARPLPWRVRPRDPYLSLVSEFMLQQTQVARVLEKFGPFIGRFGTVSALARAPEAEVLALWSGLGYYRRARLLHGAARAIVEDFEGTLPRDATALRALPGVGRYTAGAIASIVFGAREPIVDGNVARVLLRLHGEPMATGTGAAMSWAWERAGELVERSGDPALLNEGLMELGAVVCTPRTPRCEACPVSRVCAARAGGLQGSIPRARPPASREIVSCDSAVIVDRAGRVALEQRPSEGMWASMWQAPTLEHPGVRSAAAGARSLEERLGVEGMTLVERFVHTTSHREFRVRVWRAEGSCASGESRLEWTDRGELSRRAISNLQRRVLRSVFLGDSAASRPAKKFLVTPPKPG